MGKPFCTCPEGLRGDPNVGCGKDVWDMINNTDSYYVQDIRRPILIRPLPFELILYYILQKIMTLDFSVYENHQCIKNHKQRMHNRAR